MIKVCLVNLGCAKNTVDSQAILGLFKDEKEFEITIDVEEADVLILNTCAFIHDAETESFETIEYLEKLGKKLVVVGCLVEKFHDDLIKKFPKVDLFVGFKDFIKLPKLISKLINKDINVPYSIFNRKLEEDPISIYLKISEGCNHNCGYCIIPLLRGKYYSYEYEGIINYAKEAAANGVKELTVIAQDTTYYGKDFSDKKITISTLLKELDKIEGIEFIRCLYLYPDEVDFELIETIRDSKHIVPYFDLPIQHASDKMLGLMNRYDTYESLTNLVSTIRREIPNAILRCTIIVGYPGETDEDFEKLKTFLALNKFHHVGVFTFSNEKNTKAYDLPDHVAEEIKLQRKEELMNFQKKISFKLNEEMVGKKFKAIVLEQQKTNRYLVRTAFNAPDDVDGDIFMISDKQHNLGDIVEVEITDAFVYDLYSKEI